MARQTAAVSTTTAAQHRATPRLGTGGRAGVGRAPIEPCTARRAQCNLRDEMVASRADPAGCSRSQNIFQYLSDLEGTGGQQQEQEEQPAPVNARREFVVSNSAAARRGYDHQTASAWHTPRESGRAPRATPTRTPASDVKRRVGAMAADLAAREADLHELGDKIETTKQLHRDEVASMQGEHQKEVACVREDYEDTVKRQLEFIDELLKDKEENAAKCDGFVSEMEASEVKWEERLKEHQAAHKRDIKKCRDGCATALALLVTRLAGLQPPAARRVV